MNLRRPQTFLLPLLGLLVLVSPLAAKPTAPDWVTAVAAKPASFDYGKANAAALLDENVLDVDPSGVFTTRTRWVVRLLNKDGKANAVARAHYTTGSSRVKSLQAWLIRASGEVVPFGKKETIDAAVYGTALELYGEDRQMVINAEDEVGAGSVFAYEAVVIEEKSVLSQDNWFFQTSLPVERSTITVILPVGWQVEARTFNHEPISPVVNGKSMSWELWQLPAMEREPLGPPTSTSLAWLGIKIRPPANAKTTRKYFGSWTDLSVYFTPKYDAASTPDATLKAKAESLVSGVDGQWERIRRLCRYAQNVNYISIVMNSAAAGGMIPRDASRVLRCNYGDCKDKTTLLRALLRSQGIESFPVIVNSGGGRYVIPDWPTPSQFNHCILAIKVDESVNVPALFTHPTLGRFVIFDPTNTTVPPGWLPEEDCGGRGLLLAGTGGELIELPGFVRENNRTERTITAKLFSDGSVSGVIQEQFHGLASAAVREEYKDNSAADYRKLIERWVSRSLPASRLDRVEPVDHFDDARFSLTTEFSAAAHGKSMREVLLVFKPVLLSRRGSNALKKEKRMQPVVLDTASFTETNRIELPANYHVDELPASVEMIAPFGSYTARIKAEDSQHLLMERSLELRDSIIPAAEYESVRAFFEKIIKAEQSPVVLRRN